MFIGATYDEKMFNETNFDILLKAIELGLNSIELSPDSSILSIEEYKKILLFCKEKKLNINYHIPYFADNLYNIKSLISDKENVLKKYDEFFYNIKKFSNNALNKSTIVLHGEEFLPFEDKSYERTEFLINYCLNKIKELDLNVNIAIETLRRSDKKFIGDCHEDIFYLINKIDSNNFGICLDICHDSMNYFPYKPFYTELFLDKLFYIHAHGIEIQKNNPHISLVKSSINFMDIILFLKERRPELTINIELLSNNCGKESYFSDLLFDIHILNSIISH